mgnify:CR=1 FL=1
MCIGDVGLNVCGGCEVLLGTPGTPCLPGCTSDAQWGCSGGNVICTDSDDGVRNARDLGRGPEDAAAILMTRWVDGAGDIDWYTRYVEDQVGPTLAPDAMVTIASGVDLEVCTFFAYEGTTDIVPYDCGSGNCSWYDASTNSIESTSCTLGEGSFVLTTDLYGCCDRIPDAAGRYRARVQSVDATTGDQSGQAWVKVEVTDGVETEACNAYTLRLSF